LQDKKIIPPNLAFAKVTRERRDVLDLYSLLDQAKREAEARSGSNGAKKILCRRRTSS